MNQQSPDRQSQIQENLVKDTNVGRDFIFAPIQAKKYIETEIIQISVAKVTQRKLIKTSPYQGLKRFNVKDRDRFFGRDKLIARLFQAVNRSSLSLVLGASGSGKSSVVRAALIPELNKSLESSKFYDFIFTPNEDPFESLYRCLLSQEKDYQFKESEATIALESQSGTMTKVIGQLKKEDERWLIFIDQFEELFTNCGDLELRQNFINSLVEVAEAKDSTVRIVLGMRADFFEQFSAYPALGAILNQNNIHMVTEMYPDELRQAIEQPAAQHGVVFEEGLVEQIIKDVQGQSGYLPLLQYTLDLFWKTECQELAADGRPKIEKGTLNWSTYQSLGGVCGALQNQVNRIYQNLNQDEQIASKQIFLKLVNIFQTEGGTRVVRRRVYRSEFVGDLIKKTLQKLIDNNLLVSSEEYGSGEELLIRGISNHQQQFLVKIADEILIHSWSELKQWLEEEKEAIILKNNLVYKMRHWQKFKEEFGESQARNKLLKGSSLDIIIFARDNNIFKNLGGLTEDNKNFINLSIALRNQHKQEKKTYKIDEISKVINCLRNNKYDFRTIEGISKETQINKDKILKILDHSKLVRKSFLTDKYNNSLYTLKKKPIKIRELLALTQCILGEIFR